MSHSDNWEECGVRVERKDAILTITLDRPKANAINTRVSGALARAFIQLRDTADLRVGILTGGGNRFFSAGWDLKAAAEGEAVTADHGPGGFGGITEFFDLNKPVIAAVNGLAVGGGFELALACDLIVAVEHAEFFLPESGLGIIPDSGGVLRLPRALPRHIANEMLLTGRRMSATQAQGWGLVNRVVPSELLMQEAEIMATQITANAPLALQAIKQIVRQTGNLDIDEGYRRMRTNFYPAYDLMLSSDDAKEGLEAHAQSRAPVWRAC